MDVNDHTDTNLTDDEWTDEMSNLKVETGQLIQFIR